MNFFSGGGEGEVNYQLRCSGQEVHCREREQMQCSPMSPRGNRLPHFLDQEAFIPISSAWK